MAYEVVIVDPEAEITTSVGEYSELADAIEAANSEREALEDDETLYVEIREVP